MLNYNGIGEFSKRLYYQVLRRTVQLISISFNRFIILYMSNVILQTLWILFIFVRVIAGGVLGALTAFKVSMLIVLHIYKGQPDEIERIGQDDPLFERSAPIPIAMFIIYSAAAMAGAEQFKMFSFGMFIGTVFASAATVAMTHVIISQNGLFKEYRPLVQILVLTISFFGVLSFTSEWYIVLGLLICFNVYSELSMRDFSLEDTIDRVQSRRKRARLRLTMLMNDYSPIMN